MQSKPNPQPLRQITAYDCMLSSGWLNHKHWYKTETTNTDEIWKTVLLQSLMLLCINIAPNLKTFPAECTTS